MTGEHIVCIDVGGSSLKAGAIQEAGKPSGSFVTIPIDSNGDLTTIIDTFVESINITGLSARSIRGLAFSFPGPFDYRRGISQIQGLEKYNALYGLDVGQLLRDRFNLPDLPIRYRNDAEAAVVGEVRYGAGRNYRRVIGVTLGTGFGSAFIDDGYVITERNGVPPNGWLYSFPVNDARADDVFSTRGLQARFNSAGLSTLTLPIAAEQARLGDPKCREVFDSFGLDMGRFLQTFVQSFEADAVLFLGGIASAFDGFKPGLSQSLSKSLLVGELEGWAALLGAGDLFFRDPP
jgi:glucokinase